MKTQLNAHERQPCPSCGTPLDSAAEVGGKGIKIKRGDVTICIKCAALLIFDGERLGLGDKTDLPFDIVGTVMKAQARVRALQRRPP